MKYEKHPDDHNFKWPTNRGVITDLPPWLEKAVARKNPRLTVELAESFSLEYGSLDKQLLSLIRLN